MNSESKKTRAEILEELESIAGRSTKDQDMAALQRLLNMTSEGADIQKVVKRAEREYFLICARASARAEGKKRPGSKPKAVLEQDRFEEEGSVEQIIERFQQAEDCRTPEGLFMQIAIEAGRLMGAETALLALLDEDRGTYTCRAAVGPRALDCLDTTVPVSEASVCGWVIRQNIYFTAADVRTDLRSGSLFKKTLNAKCVAAAPLSDNGTVVGVIAVANGRGGAEITKRETREMLVPFGRGIARLLAAIGKVRS
jgi:hypothetical protein